MLAMSTPEEFCEKWQELMQQAIAMPEGKDRNFALATIAATGLQIVQNNGHVNVQEVAAFVTAQSGITPRQALADAIMSVYSQANVIILIKSLLGPDNLFFDKSILPCDPENCPYCMLYTFGYDGTQYFEDDLNFHFADHYESLKQQFEGEPEKLAALEAKMK